MRRVAVGFALSAFVMSGVHAHELGTLETTLHVDRSGAFRAEMAVDPDALLTKLEVFSNQPVSGRLPRAERDSRIVALGQTFLDVVRVRFDDAISRPVFHYQSNDAEMPDEPATVRLVGKAPRDARTIAFSDGLTMGTYALRVLVDGRIASLVWLTRGEESPPVRIAHAPEMPRAAGTFVAVMLVFACLALAWRARRAPARRSKLLRPAHAQDHRYARHQGLRVPRTIRPFLGSRRSEHQQGGIRRRIALRHWSVLAPGRGQGAPDRHRKEQDQRRGRVADRQPRVQDAGTEP